MNALVTIEHLVAERITHTNPMERCTLVVVVVLERSLDLVPGYNRGDGTEVACQEAVPNNG